MSSISTSSVGVSPQFQVTAEEFDLQLRSAVTRVSIDGVEPPTLGAQGGPTVAFQEVNHWYPWIDDKLVAPKFDGVAQYTGRPSNQPTFIRDFHTIALMRAVDYLLAPRYEGLIQATVTSVSPSPPPIP